MSSAHRILHDLFRAGKSLTDPGAAGTIRPNQDLQVCELVTAAAEARTLSNPTKIGVRFVLRMKTDGGDATVTAANGLNVGGNTIATFADVGDQLELISVSHTTGYRWEILINTGSVALS